MKKNTPFIVFVYFISAVFLSGCGGASYTEHSIELKKVAPPEIIAMDGKAKLYYGEFVRRQLEKRLPNLKTIIVGDKRYLFITEKWFMDLVHWTEYFIKQQVPELENLEELPIAYAGTFAELMSSIANIAVAKRYNVKASVLIGLILAESNKPWGKIEADGKNRVYLVALTEEGVLIYDIATHQFSRGKDFPNKKSTTKILL